MPEEFLSLTAKGGSGRVCNHVRDVMPAGMIPSLVAMQEEASFHLLGSG